MGVYSRLYAPIFNYIHMSQAEKNTSTDTPKKPRLYNRGNDQINLEDYIRNLESGFDTWLNSRKIKDKHKEAVREAYREMITRLNSGDGSFTSRLGGGFQDSTGKIKNADKGFDAYGVAASYLGNTLRSMDVYKEPEPTPDPSKIKYGNGAIGTALTRRLLGSAGTVQDFIDRDPYNKDTRTRGNSVRSKEFRSALESLANDWEAGTGEFSDFTDEQRTQGLKDIRGLFTIFDNDGQITDDEYLQLARVTGMSNLRQMFATGEPSVAQDETVRKVERTHADKIRAIQQKWRPYTGQLISPITIGDASSLQNLGPWTQQRLGQAFNSATVQDLTTLIQDLILNSDYRKSAFIQNLKFPSHMVYPLGTDFTTVRSFLLENALTKLKNMTADHNGGLHNFGENNQGAYYIGGTNTDRNTGFVWDSNNNTISEMSIHNIPYWQNYINNWWDSQGDDSDESDLDPTLTSIYREGGIIKKLATGGTADYNAVARYDLTEGRNARYMYDIPSKTWIQRNLRSINTIAPDNKQYNSEGDVTEMQASELFQNWIRDLTSDKDLAKYWAENYINNHDDQKIADFWKSQWYTNGNFDFDKFKTAKGLNGKFVWDDNLGGVGHDRYSKSVWYDPEDKMYHSELVEGYEADGDWTFDPERFLYVRNMKKIQQPEASSTDNALAARRSVIASAQQPGAKPKEELFGLNNSDVEEVDTGVKAPSSRGTQFLNTMTDLAPDLLDAGRLFASLNANNRIADIIRPSLKPVLKDTYERYSPVTGAFSTMQLKNRQGAEVLSQSQKPFTSDASLAAARMLEGHRQANDLQTQGFLADDQEIKRTQAEALARQEDNMARRSEVTNFNRASINQTNREKAQLEATRVNKNWRSWDNFLEGIGTQLRTRADENRQDRLAYQKQQDELTNSLIYQNELDQIQNLISKYTAANPTQSLSSTPWWTSVSQRQIELARRLQNDNIISAGRRRGYSYTDLYRNNPYVAIDWSKIIV